MTFDPDFNLLQSMEQKTPRQKYQCGSWVLLEEELACVVVGIMKTDTGWRYQLFLSPTANTDWDHQLAHAILHEQWFRDRGLPEGKLPHDVNLGEVEACPCAFDMGWWNDEGNTLSPYIWPQRIVENTR